MAVMRRATGSDSSAEEKKKNYDMEESKEWAVVVCYGKIFGEKNVGPFLASVLALIKEVRVQVPCKDHAAGAVGDSVILVCGNVVK